MERSRSRVCGSSLVRAIEGVGLDVMGRNRVSLGGRRSLVRGESVNLAWGRRGNFAPGKEGV